MFCFGTHKTLTHIYKTQLEMARLADVLAAAGVDAIFPDAPHSARGPPTDDNPFAPPHYEWWNAERTPHGWVYDGADDTLALVARTLTATPCDGVLGFSQGCILGAIILHLVQSKSPLLQGAAFLPRFGLFFCGIPPRTLPPAVAAAVGGVPHAGALPPLAAPSLHVIGRRDPAAPRALAAGCVAPVVIEHERGHVIPRLVDGDVDTLRAFLEARAEEGGVISRL
jgi:Serine hydrolase (FSH1)